MDQPSEAQIKAGNYSKGHVYAHGMRISIENPADSVRSGVGKDGEPWDSRMQHDYGYIRGTEGADGDHMDVFLGPDFKSREVPVHVIDQHDEDGKFDEHKVMLGFKDKDAALRAYMGNYPDGYTGARAITPMHIDKFKEWMVGPGAKKSVSKVKKFADGGYTGWDAFNTLEREKIKAAGIELPEHITQSEMDDIGRKVWPTSQLPPVGYASGGGVTAGPWWDSYQEGPTEAQPAASAPTLTLEDFRKRITPNMLDAEGKFKAPIAGVNYMLEGLTPEQAYSSAQPQTGPEIDGGSGQYQNTARSQMLDPSWRTGPNNGGGFLGGIGNAVQGMFDGVRTNPAIMAALSAGIAPYVSKGLTSAGMGTAAAKTATPLLMNAGKTIVGGGSVENALKGAGTGYITGQVGDFAVANNPIPEVLNSNVVKYLAGTAIKGKSADPFGLASAFLTGEAKKPVQKLADGGSIAESDAQAAKDVAHSTQVMKQMLRGWAAGTAGLPGDLEGLARKVVGWGATEGSPVDAWSKRDPVMPTSAFYKEWLPGHPDEPRLREAADLGSLAGGVGVTSLARPLAKGAGALTKALAESAPGPMAGSLSAQRGVIKAPGGNWRNGSVEDALAGLKRSTMGDNPDVRRLMGDNIVDHRLIEDKPIEHLNNWVDKQLTRYVKNDMATERDPIRALAEQGVLHFEPRHIDSMALGPNRLEAGFRVAGYGDNQLAKNWERQADSAVNVVKAGQYQKEVGPGWEANAWLDKTAPEVPVHSIPNKRGLPRDLGLDHLADELRNAMNPESGLPRHLQLKPESLNSVSVPQAVKLVSDINKWRAEQKVIANKAVANNPATFTHKEYPDTGFKWVELKQPSLAKVDDLPEWQRKMIETNRAQGIDDGRGVVEATGELDKKHLQDALKYEGDTMGHCVGGYCDDVASGNTRILSLRDAKGEPHATVEIKPGRMPSFDGGFEDLPDDAVAAARAAMPRGDFSHGPLVRQWIRENWHGGLVQQPPQILQIKGKGNKGVADKYRPMVQDFLNTFEHSAAQDLQLNGMRATKDAWNAAELAKIKAAGIEVPRYATQAKIDDIGNIVWPTQWGAAK